MILLILKILNHTIEKKTHKDIGIYNIGYTTIKKKISDCKNIYSVNPLYSRITHASRYIEEINKNKYLIFDLMELHSIDEKKQLLKKYIDVFNKIRNKIKEVCSNECDYEKNCMKIKFNLDDKLPLNKPLNFHNITITIGSVFEEDGKLYLDDTLYE